ncbi:hypothetical protein [Actinacidiphila yeochonensis]|uniref:hypothetical protein n=1 Tax=Actinacidiphila yeochonensis TaxID=89050 RepID=UPI0005670FC3
MTTTTIIAKLTDRPVMSACSLLTPAVSFRGIGLSSSASALLPVIPALERIERPTEASEAAVVAAAPAYAFTTAAEGAGAGGASGAKGANGHAHGQKTQHGMRAFRGLEPWSDPA